MSEDLRLVANGGSYVETGDDNSDTTGVITATASAVTATAISRNVSMYRYRDFGASYFPATGAYAEGSIVLSAPSGTSYKPIAIGFSADLADDASVVNEAGGWFSINGANTLGFFYAHVRESSVEHDTVLSTNFTIGSTYYYRLGYFSSLGQYGGVLLQIFSDSAKTTLIEAKVQLRTASAAYRYFMAMQSYNNASSTNYLTAVNSDITLGSYAPGVDLTTYTHSAGTAIAAYADVMVATALAGNATEYWYKDYTANYITSVLYQQRRNQPDILGDNEWASTTSMSMIIASKLEQAEDIHKVSVLII